MKNFEFKSQICTTKPQSEALLALGLKKETADCALHYDYVGIDGEVHHMAYEIGHKCCGIPAWSLHRLLEMLYADIGECMIFFPHVYDEVIADIENLIRRGIFNKDYLEERK